MVHPTTSKTISSYKQLVNNPVTANTWQTAFGEDFGSMCQGDNKTGAKGTNAMFVMKPEEVDHTLAARLATYANIVVDPQIPGYGQTIPRSSSRTCQHHLNVAREPTRLS
jgi:hypothetical protein